MNKREDGEPAFPVQDCSKWQYPGLSLRDYFAIHAKEPDVETVRAAQQYDHSRNPYNDGPPKPQLRDAMQISAELRYQYADAMLAERSK